MSLESIEVRDDDWEMIDRPAGLEAQEDADDTPSATADTAEGMNASAAEIVGQLALASMGSEYGEPVESVQDRKSTRMNSSHVAISYAVYCLNIKNENLMILH